MLNFNFIFTIFKDQIKINDGKIGVSELIGYFKDFTVLCKTDDLWKSCPGKAERFMNFEKDSEFRRYAGLNTPEMGQL
jgi:hypothetical protein